MPFKSENLYFTSSAVEYVDPSANFPPTAPPAPPLFERERIIVDADVSNFIFSLILNLRVLNGSITLSGGH